MIIHYCEACKRAVKAGVKKTVNIANQEHHKFPDTTPNVRLYGQKTIDDPRNKEWACSACNPSHASPFLTHWSEKEFCDNLGIGEPRSKNWQIRKLREGK